MNARAQSKDCSSVTTTSNQVCFKLEPTLELHWIRPVSTQKQVAKLAIRGPSRQQRELSPLTKRLGMGQATRSLISAWLRMDSSKLDNRREFTSILNGNSRARTTQPRIC